MNSKLANKRVDFLVTEPDGSRFLLVEIKRHNIDRSGLDQIGVYAELIKPDFVIAVDPQQILVAQTKNGSPDWDHATRLSTLAVLGQYTDASSLDQVESFYLQSLVEAWLMDFAEGWKSARPPGYQELESIGLAGRLRGSQIHVEAQL